MNVVVFSGTTEGRSFSRALAEKLRVSMSDAEFNAALDKAIESIYQASIT